MPRQLFPGLLVCRGSGSYSHQFGGTHQIRGAICPNCVKPLVLHMNLDLRDPKVRLGADGAAFPLLYCMRCCLCWYDFAYRVRGDEEVEIVLAHLGQDRDEKWDQHMGDTLDPVPITLANTPAQLQEMMDELNASSKKFTTDDRSEWNLLLDRPTRKSIDAINQVGGRSFLIQRLPDPVCPTCKDRTAYFLASLYNDERIGIRVTPPLSGAQIVFFYCPDCQTVVVQHST